MLDSPKPPPGQPADPFGLKSYLTAPSTPAHAPTYHETQGLLFAVAAAPQPVPPTEWLALVLGRKQPDLGRVAEPVIDDVFKLYGRQVHRISSQSVRLPRDCRFRDDVMSNFAEDAPMRQWCHGFLNGHVWVGEAWEVPLSDEVAQELGAVLLTLPFFSSREFADESLADMSNCKTLLEAAEMTRRLFTDAMGSYAAISQAIRQALADAASRSAVKVGRNEPCPCGSGKKYKRCCFGVKN